MIDEWYAPSEVWSRWWKPHCVWVLTHFIELKEGHYPTRDGGSGYTDGYGRSKSYHTSHATAEAEEMYAEMDRRLVKCREDGVLLKLHYAMGEGIDVIAKHFGVTEEEIVRRMQTALKYIARKKVNYAYRRWFYAKYQPKKLN